MMIIAIVSQMLPMTIVSVMHIIKHAVLAQKICCQKVKLKSSNQTWLRILTKKQECGLFKMFSPTKSEMTVAKCGISPASFSCHYFRLPCPLLCKCD